MANNNNQNGNAKKFYNENMLVMTCIVMSDPEFKYTPQGIAILSFRTGISSGDKTVWIKVNVWRERGEALSQYIKKGMKITVYGKLGDNQAYNTKDGKLGCTLEVNADQIALPQRGEGDAQPGAKAQQPANKLPTKEINDEGDATQIDEYEF